LGEFGHSPILLDLYPFKKHSLKRWFPLAVAITLVLGIVYVVGQQGYRMSVNDPQIQLAEDAATALTNGQLIDSVVPTKQVDIASSLAPFVVVFDDSGKGIASSGLLHNQMPTLPSGVFDYVRKNGQDRITWQPEPGIRSAVIVTRYTGQKPGFVMAGRSMRESEVRTNKLFELVVVGGMATLVATLIAIALAEFVVPEK
jgi:hypothetical protein